MNLEKKINGFISANNTVLDYESVKRSIQLIRSLHLSEKSITTKPINQKRIPKIARKNIDDLFPALNKDILYLSQQELQRISSQHKEKKQTELETLNQINSKASIINIFDIPLNYQVQNARYGYAVVATPLLSNPTFWKKINPIATQINLYGPSDYLTAIIYTHELIHLFIRRNKGIIEDYYHEELIPIFLEKVFALETDPTEDLLSKVEMHRINYQQNDINIIEKNLDNVEQRSNQHLISSLLANYLFYQYYNSSSKEKQSILNRVQQILNGEKKLTEFLNEQKAFLEKREIIDATEHSIKKSLIKKK